MNRQTSPWLLVALSSMGSVVLSSVFSVGYEAWAENTELDSDPRVIPYNGFLEFNGESLNGQVDIRFTLTDDESCNFTEDHNEVSVHAGRFSVSIGQPSRNVPSCVFDAERVYLQMAVRSADDDSAHVALAGRQRINPVPFAYWAAEGSDFKVDGNANLGGDADVAGALRVGGELTARRSVSVENNVTAGGDISGRNAVFTGTARIGGAITGNGNDLQINDEINAMWDIYNSRSDVTIRDNLHVTGVVRNPNGRFVVDDAFSVHGGAEFQSPVDMDLDLNVGRTVTAHTLNGVLRPGYQNWSTLGMRNGEAAIVNDNVDYDALMVVGNGSGGGVRRVEMYDDVEVSRTLRARYLDIRDCRICLNYGDSNGNTRHHSCTRLVGGAGSGRMNLVGTVNTDDSFHLSFRCDGGGDTTGRGWP